MPAKRQNPMTNIRLSPSPATTRSHRRGIGAVLALCLLAAPPEVRAATPADAPHFKKLPQLFIKPAAGAQDQYAVFVNGFLVANGSWHDPVEIGRETGGDALKASPYFPILPYYLKKGANQIEVALINDDVRRPLGVDLYLAESGTQDQMKSAGTHVGGAAPGEIIPTKNRRPFPFFIDGDLPAWDWTAGARIEDTPATRASLLTAYQRLSQALGRKDCPAVQALHQPAQSYTQALQRVGLTSRKVARMCDILAGKGQVAGDELTFGRLAQPTQLLLYGDQRVAELSAGQTPLLHAEGPIDGGGGRMNMRGPTQETFHVWFRRSEKGDWIIVR